MDFEFLLAVGSCSRKVQVTKINCNNLEKETPAEAAHGMED